MKPRKSSARAQQAYPPWNLHILVFSLSTVNRTIFGEKPQTDRPTYVYNNNNNGHFKRPLTLYGHIKTAHQRTIIQQYGDWYTDR